jgi:hypothetical protein
VIGTGPRRRTARPGRDRWRRRRPCTGADLGGRRLQPIGPASGKDDVATLRPGERAVSRPIPELRADPDDRLAAQRADDEEAGPVSERWWRWSWFLPGTRRRACRQRAVRPASHPSRTWSAPGQPGGVSAARAVLPQPVAPGGGGSISSATWASRSRAGGERRSSAATGSPWQLQVGRPADQRAASASSANGEHRARPSCPTARARPATSRRRPGQVGVCLLGTAQRRPVHAIPRRCRRARQMALTRSTIDGGSSPTATNGLPG